MDVLKFSFCRIHLLGSQRGWWFIYLHCRKPMGDGDQQKQREGHPQSAPETKASTASIPDDAEFLGITFETRHVHALPADLQTS